MGADPRIDDARWLLDWITRTNRTQFSRRDAHRAAPRGRFPKATDLEPALRLLEEHGYLRRVDAEPSRDPRGRGRPASPRFLVNPLPRATETTETTKNHRRSCFCGFCGFCGAWRHLGRAADEGADSRCHVIQRERPQPFPAISGARCPAATRPPAACLVRLDRRHPRGSTGRGWLLAALEGAEARMGSVTWRKRGHRYQVSWRLDDGSQGAKTVDSADEARDLAAEKRLELRRGTWQGRRRGRLAVQPVGR